MNKKYTASMLAEGNHLFQASITVTDEGLIMKIPKFWNDKETFFRYQDVSGFSIDTPSWYTVLSYCTIHLNARGTWVEAHGFTKSDAQKIKRYIEDGQRGNGSSGSRGNAGSGSYNSSSPISGREYHEEWMKNSRRKTEELYAEIRRLGEEAFTENKDLIEKIKKVLTKSLQLFYLYNYNEDDNGADKIQIKIKEQKKYLIKYLRKNGEETQYESILEECRISARIEHDRQIADINESRKVELDSFLEGIKEKNIEYFKGIGEKKSDFEIPTLGNFLKDSDEEYKNQIKILASAYDTLDVELLEDCEKVNLNSLLVEFLIKNIIEGGKGRAFIKKEIHFIDFENYIYAVTVEKLFDIIDGIYNSIAYQQTEDASGHGKKVFAYGLDYPKTIDYLRNEDNSLCDRMSKLIDVTDNFINRICKYL